MKRLFWIILILLLILFFSLFYKIETYDNIFTHKLYLMASFKNETMNLKVWIEHYIKEGVEQIYLIDNNSDDNPMAILQPYIDRGIVKYFFLPEKHQQAKHYRQIIESENLKTKTEWLIICDLDEFYYGYPNTLINTLDEFSQYNIIYSNWVMFGSDGLIEHPENILKSIVWRELELSSHTKYIFKPSKIDDVNTINIHNIHNLDNKITENEKIRLNHYPIQSLEFFKKVKMTRGDGDNSGSDNVRDMNYFNRYDQNKTLKDDVLANKY